MNLNFTYLATFFKEHPVSFASMRNAFAFFAVIAFPLGLMAFHDFHAQLAIDIINENRAPRTFQIICSVSLIFLSAYVAARGPITSLKGRAIRVFGVYFPNAALGIGAAYVGVAWGAFIAALFSGIPLPPPYTFGVLIRECLLLLFGLLALYTFFVLVTVNASVAPGYQNPSFRPTMRVLAALFCFAMLGRTVLLLVISLGATK
ncbi:hypothetical protein AB7849_14890 [Rhodanobacter sp. 115]|uniref:hypothetical protein n=1 Tax=Rhodanobacter sp. FW021-MT20 TaxID=1162282 RepID=UPI000260DFB5|nr:hypothetical protein [Rhodanobacter sp. 115]EIL86875.1 hypothetical protein UU5_20740 [Rhodanobacter sp. 115]